MKITYRLHAIERMLEREIVDSDVAETITNGKIIESYPDDKPYQSYLYSKSINNRPIHVVAALNSIDDEIIVITAYVADPEKWSENFERRK